MTLCPYCGGTFKNLRSHILWKHPEHSAEVPPRNADGPMRETISDQISVSQSPPRTGQDRYFDMTPQERSAFRRSGGRLAIRDPEDKFHFRLIRNSSERLTELRMKCPDYEIVPFIEAIDGKKVLGAEMASNSAGSAAIGTMLLARCPKWSHDERQADVVKEAGEKVSRELDDAKQAAARAGFEPMGYYKEEAFVGKGETEVGEFRAAIQGERAQDKDLT